MGMKFSNNAVAKLNAGINDSVTTFDVQAGEGDLFPAVTVGATDYFYCTLIDSSGNREVIKVTHRNGGSNTFSVVERGADGTDPRAFSTNDAVELRTPSIVFEEFDASIVALAARVTVNETDLAGTTNPATVPAPSGQKMFFYSDTVPATWTIDTGPADSLLAVIGGSQDYNDTGGQVLGSWTPTNHTHTGPSHTHTGPSHVHTMGTHIHTMPSHTHTMPTHVHTGPSHTHTGPSHTHVRDWAGTSATGKSLDHSSFTLSGQTLTILKDGSSSFDRVKFLPAGAASGTGTTAASGTGNTGATDPGDTNSKDPGDTNATDPGDTNAGGTAATGAGGTGATGGSAGPSTDRPKAAGGVIGTKD